MLYLVENKQRAMSWLVSSSNLCLESLILSTQNVAKFRIFKEIFKLNEVIKVKPSLICLALLLKD